MISNIISNGIVDSLPYILLQKGKGKRVYEIWHLLNDLDREKIVKQISDFFNCMFDLKYNNLFKNDFTRELKSNLNYNINAINIYIDNKLFYVIISFINNNTDIFNNEENVICYTDMHFDNILVDDECNITTVFDFEDVKIGPKYCVLDTFVRMSRYPYLYANEADEKNVRVDDYTNIVIWLKKYNSEVFNYNNLDVKLKLIALEYDMRQLIDYPNNEGLKKRIFEDLYK